MGKYPTPRPIFSCVWVVRKGLSYPRDHHESGAAPYDHLCGQWGGRLCDPTSSCWGGSWGNDPTSMGLVGHKGTSPTSHLFEDGCGSLMNLATTIREGDFSYCHPFLLYLFNFFIKKILLKKLHLSSL